jgi:hypothetical protein
MLLLLLACSSPPPPPVLAPETHSWKDEAQLVIDGLDEVERLWKAGNKDAAKVLAERVYTDRWEPRLEQAARRIEGAAAAAPGTNGPEPASTASAGAGASPAPTPPPIPAPGDGAPPDAANAPVIETEYAFSLLLLELDGPGRDVEGKIHTLEERTRAIADVAARRFPPPDSAPPPPPAGEGSRPIVPDVKPAWEGGAPG